MLTTRLAAMNKKLMLETKIRDAAVSLSKAKGSLENGSPATTTKPDDQLDVASKKVESTQKELYRISERYNEIQRKLLEHRAGVLSRSVKSLERKTTTVTTAGTMDDTTTTTSGSSTPNRSSQMSPITASSVTSVQTAASSKGRFDGAHLFAGHVDALPVSPRSPARQMTNGTGSAVAALSGAATAELEEKLQAATAALEAATAQHAEMARELEGVRREKEQLEGTLGAEQGAVRELQEEVARMGAMETQLHAMAGEQGAWAEERAEMERRWQEEIGASQQEIARRAAKGRSSPIVRAHPH